MIKKTLNRLDKTFRLREIYPELQQFSFSFNNVIGYTGSIFRRPLDSNIPGYHFGFFLGFDRSKTLWMIENNYNGVECLTWRDFLAGAIECEIVHYEKNNANFGEILRRIVEKQDLP